MDHIEIEVKADGVPVATIMADRREDDTYQVTYTPIEGESNTYRIVGGDRSPMRIAATAAAWFEYKRSAFWQGREPLGPGWEGRI